MGLLGRIGNIFRNDVARPVQRNIQPVQRTISQGPRINAQQLAQALQQNVVRPVINDTRFIQHIAQPVIRNVTGPPPPHPSLVQQLAHAPAQQVQAVAHNVSQFASAVSGNKQAQQQFLKEIKPPSAGTYKNGKIKANPEFTKYAVGIVGGTEGSKSPALPEKSPAKLPQSVNPKKPAPIPGQGSVQKPNTQELKIGKALGMSKEDVAKAKAIEARPPLTQAPEMSVPHGTIQKVPTSMRPIHEQYSADINTGRNPIKVNVPEVPAGDYQKARSNAQLASNPIEVATGQTVNAVNKLSPNEKANFWKMVEDPSLVKSSKAQEAVNRWRQLADTSHATSQSLGGNTNYLENYARHNWDLSNPEMAGKFEELVNQRGGSSVDPFNFRGIDSQPRVFNSIAEGEKQGFKLQNANPAEDILKYGSGTAHALKRQALIKGITEADMPQPLKNRAFDLRNGNTLPVSEKGLQELRNFERNSTNNPVLKGYRATNRKLKQTLLSVSQFHTININALQAAPTLALKGHPVLATKGLVQSAGALFNKGVADNVLQGAIKDGTIENAARLGTPIKFGSDYTASGKLPVGKAGVGERAIFERQLPVMHVQMVKGLVKDLERKGISLDSPQARKAGTTVNQIMGFVNQELRNFDPRVQRGLSDVALAPQFTRGKWETLGDAVTKGGQAGSYARRAVIGKYATEAGIALVAGAILKQKSDDLKDVLIRSLIHPAIPTPFKDSKGNTLELGMPQNYASEALGLGSRLKRNDQGRLGVDLNPENIGGNLKEYGRSRLAVLPSSGLKIATNENYSGKPLYESNAPLSKKAEQAGTTVGAGLLPIGLQGVAQTKVVKDRLPRGVKDVVEANSPGSNPVLKSVASSFGFTPRTDKTVGKGQETTEYFENKDKFARSLNPAEKNLFNKLTQQKKDAFGNQIKTSTPLTKVADYSDLVSNPKFALKYQNYQKAQKSHDPLWDLPPDQLRSYMQAQIISKNDPGGDSNTTRQLYGRLPQDFFSKRESYFANLKKSGVNLGKSSPQKPQMPANLQAFSNTYNNLPYGTGQRSSALRSSTGQAYVSWLNQNKLYNNQERADLGLPPLEDTSSKYASSGSKGRSASSKIATIKPPKLYTPKKIKAPSLKGISSKGSSKSSKVAFKKPSQGKKPKAIKIA